MGKVSDYLINAIAKQVDTSGLVVWYDPEGHYRDIVQNLTIPGTIIAHYTDSFFALRHEIEPLLGSLEPPHLVIYVPLSQVETHNALVECEAAGLVMKPGQQPPARNTRLSLIARNALKSHMTDEDIASVEKQVEAGKLSLMDLDKLAEGEGKGILSIIFSIDNPQDIALQFLTDDQYDKDLVQKGAESELATLLHNTFEIDVSAGESLDALRTRFARHILSTDFIADMQGEVPTRLATVKIATQPTKCEACATLARTWRFRRDLAQSYETHSNRVEKELALSTMSFKQEEIAHVETFLEVERKRQESVETTLLTKSTDALVELATKRLSSFWSEHVPEVQSQWALITVAGQVLLEADRIERELKVLGRNVNEIFQAYSTGDHPWCLLDTSYRRMEHRYYDFSFQLHERLEQLIVTARNRYMAVGSTLAEAFLRAYQAQKFRIDGVMRQVEIFEKKVKPSLSEDKVAYVWVDALRYEMGYELAQSLAAYSEMTIEAALGTVPTITEIGMAALLPITRTPVTVVSAGDGKLALEIEGTCIKDRKDRVNFLKMCAGVGVTVFETKLENLLPKPGKKVQEGIKNANLVLITSQEIDAMGEEDNVALARQTMDEMLRQLKKAFRVLGQHGVETIIVTADHGHLFAEELGGDMKINPPGGDTRDLHRRVWVGHGGTADPSYLRARLSDFGLEGDLEIAVPWNFACFKVQGGAEAYFHGGMSPQELIIPVVTLTAKKSAAGTTSEIAWNLELGSQKISTRLCSVQITGKATSWFEMVPPKVRLEIRSGQQCISLPVSASYGFEESTGDVQLRPAEHDPQLLEPNSLALAIPEPLPKATVSIHLLDASTGVQLARIEKVEMAITI